MFKTTSAFEVPTAENVQTSTHGMFSLFRLTSDKALKTPEKQRNCKSKEK